MTSAKLGPASVTYDKLSLPLYVGATTAAEYYVISSTNSGSGPDSGGLFGNGFIGVKGFSGRPGGAGLYGVFGAGPDDGGSGVAAICATKNCSGLYAEATNSASGSGAYGIYAITRAANGIGIRAYNGGGGYAGYFEGNVRVLGNNINPALESYLESPTNSALYARNTLGNAAYLEGNVQVTGNISKGGGSFKIDHPLDPENKYLSHSFVESPDMMNIYNGNVTTDGEGNAIIELPAYFETLNRDFRYQLTVLGQFAQAIVAEKIRKNRFTIKTDRPNVEVSWQVTGVRQDPFANANRIQVEEEKPVAERGRYLHPQALGRPADRGIQAARQIDSLKEPRSQSAKAADRP